jgi:hypothetical protein
MFSFLPRKEPIEDNEFQDFPELCGMCLGH